jgi:hypothetical protein
MAYSFGTLVSSLDALGYSCFPVYVFRNGDRREKLPCVSSWKPYMDRKPFAAEVESWVTSGKYESYASVGIAIPKGYAVLDVDATADPIGFLMGLPSLESTNPPIVRTPGGGVHAYYRLPDGARMGNGADVFKGRQFGGKLDIRGYGGYVVAPGSPLWDAHPIDSPPAGDPSTFYTGDLPSLDELPMLPQGFIDSIGQREPAYKDIFKKELITEGSRNETAASLAWMLAMQIRDFEDEAEIEDAHLTFLNTVRTRFVDGKGFSADSMEVKKAWESALRKFRSDAVRVEKPVRIEHGTQSSGTTAPSTKNPATLGVWPVSWASDGEVYGDLVTAKVAWMDGHGTPFDVHLSAKSLCSQASFREDFVRACGIVLPKVSERMFFAFVTSLTVAKVETRVSLLSDRVRSRLSEIADGSRGVSDADTRDDKRRFLSDSDFVKWIDSETGRVHITFTVDSFRRDSGFHNEAPCNLDAAFRLAKCRRLPVEDYGIDAYEYEV